MMGVQLLSQLTCEMNQISEADANRSLTKHRKIASSFRDSQLFEVRRVCPQMKWFTLGPFCPLALALETDYFRSATPGASE